MVTIVLRKRFKRSDMACWATWERLFLNLGLHLGEAQCSSDITSKIRMLLEEIFGEHILRKPDIRRKMRILNSLTVPKNVEGRALRDFVQFCMLRLKRK